MWSTFALSPGTTYVVRFSTASVYIRADGIRWGIAAEYPAKPQRPAPCSPARNPPAGLSWRYSALLGAAELTIRPALSPRPYEVQISEPLAFFPGVEIDGYMFLPLQAEVQMPGGAILGSVPLAPGKTSWFGTPQEGVLCDAVVSTFSAEAEVGRFLAKPDPALAVCPVTLRNEMPATMDLSRLCVPTDSLSIYGREGIFATDRVYCSFSADGLQVNPRRGMDPLLGAMDVKHPARKVPETKIFSIGKDILRSITGI